MTANGKRYPGCPIAARVMFTLSAVFTAILWTPTSVFAGFAFMGAGTTIFIPPTSSTPRIVPTIAPSQPPFIVSCIARARRAGKICRWFIAAPGTPIFPIGNAVPLIRDNTAFLSTAPVVVPAGVWGVWDPPGLVDGDATIRVAEIFTGLDLAAPPIRTDDFAQLISVTGVPGLDISDFPSGALPVPQPVGLDSNLQVVTNELIGLVTGTVYPTSLIATSFSDLLPTLLSIFPPGTPIDVSQFDGASGDVVVSFADVLAKDVILFGAAVPEPATVMLLTLGLIGLGFSRRSAVQGPAWMREGGDNPP